MKINEIYTACANIEPDARFYIYLQGEGNFYKQINGIYYRHFDFLPYGYVTLREVEKFEVSEDGFTVHVELKPER